MRPASDGDAGGGLLDPVAIASLALLVLNDHVFKAAARGTAFGVVTGKLSDIAGMVFFPVLVVAGIELLGRVRRSFSGPQPRVAVVVAVVVATVFALTKVSTTAGQVYAMTWAIMQWPFRMAQALWSDGAAPALRPVAHVVDPTDVVAIVGVLYVVWQTRRRATVLRRG